MLNIVHMTVNGKDVELAVDPRESLLDTLRNRLGLTSVKKGCEVGECGACTVLVDGEAIDSCIYLTMWAEGRRIMTVEGLKGPNGESHSDSIHRGSCRAVRFLYTRTNHVSGGDCRHRKAVQPGGTAQTDFRPSVQVHRI